MVIQALSDRQAHVPYRDSKLTRVLVDSLGGNSKTTLIICCAAEDRHVSETISTLRFGERAASVQQNAQVNQELGPAELKAMLAAARQEIDALQKQLRAVAAGGALPSVPPGGTGTAMASPPQGPSTEERTVLSSLPSVSSSSSEAAETVTNIAAAEGTDGTDGAGDPAPPESESAPVVLDVTDSDEYRSLQTQLAEAQARRDEAVSESLRFSREAETAAAQVEALEAQLATAASEHEESRVLFATELKSLKTTVDELQAKVVEANLKARDAEAKFQSANEDARRYQGEMEEHRQAATKVRPVSVASIPENEDADTYVNRLLLKLTQEQEARADLEDQLDTAMQELWRAEKSKEEQGGKGSSSSFFSMFSSPNRVSWHPYTYPPFIHPQ